MVHLLSWYSPAYASNRYRACSSSSSGSRPRRTSRTLWPGYSPARSHPGWSRCSPAPSWRRWNWRARAAAFALRRDTAIIAVSRSTGIRLAELAGLRYSPDRLREGCAGRRRGVPSRLAARPGQSSALPVISAREPSGTGAHLAAGVILVMMSAAAAMRSAAGLPRGPAASVSPWPQPRLTLRNSRRARRPRLIRRYEHPPGDDHVPAAKRIIGRSVRSFRSTTDAR